MKKFLPKALLFIFLSCFSIVSTAQLFEVSLDEKVQHANLIVEGTVIEKHSFWNPSHTMIFTSNKIKLHKIFKGAFSAPVVEVLTQGGSVGTDEIQVSELAQLQVGDVGVFFLYPNSIQIKDPNSNLVLWDIYSSAQGAFKYDVYNRTASAPFVRFENIETKLYPTLVQKAGRNYEVVDPYFNEVANSAPTQTNNVLGITSFSPTTVVAGATVNAAQNLLTINGTDFGNPTGSAAVLFDDANNGTGGTAFVVAANSPLIVSWTNTQIQVRVPTSAGTGFISVRDELSAQIQSATRLNVSYSILSASFTGYTAQSNLMDDNSLGGYTVLYSTSIAGSGLNLDESPVKATFQRALNTWKEINGLNFVEGGTTTTQTIASSDGINAIMFDNLNTGVAPLASGVLAVCYSRNSTCTPVGSTAVRKVEFDIVIRNPAVSTGSVNFENGPCYPASNAIDMETVLFHELGHALNLGHINDDYQFAGGSYLNANPSKVMNYSVIAGPARKNPDWSCFIGANYAIIPKGLTLGTCIAPNAEMVPLSVIVEPKDECPTFPASATPANTLVNFDLVHATSNLNTDPQYTQLKCDGTGTGVTNTAFYAIRTAASGTLSLSVTGFTTSPVELSACGTSGVEIALYQVASCPAGQSFPVPIACRTFNANGNLADITGLTANTPYLIMVDGQNATKANFNLLLNGTALPVRILSFTGVAKNNFNELKWDLEVTPDVTSIILESSNDAITFEPIDNNNLNSNSQRVGDFFNDYTLVNKKFYRLKIVNKDGSIEYSSILLLRRDSQLNMISISPNPVSEYANIQINRSTPATLSFTLSDMSGKTIWNKTQFTAAGAQTVQLNEFKNLSSGTYLLKVWDGEKLETLKLMKL
jgi:hypothetical protein